MLLSLVKDITKKTFHNCKHIHIYINTQMKRILMFWTFKGTINCSNGGLLNSVDDILRFTIP